MHEDPDVVWPAIMGTHGTAMQATLAIFHQVPASAIAKAIDRITQEQNMGPMLDPTAWLDGTKFRNADVYLRVLRAALTLRETLPDGVYVPEAEA